MTRQRLSVMRDRHERQLAEARESADAAFWAGDDERFASAVEEVAREALALGMILSDLARQVEH